MVNRAKSNTYDTEVIEKVAPGELLLEYNEDIAKLIGKCCSRRP